MRKFIEYYALEIYTVISMAVLTAAGLAGGMSMIQKAMLVYIFLFVLHEWEEMKYPGGFADYIAKMLGIEINEEIKRASRIPTSILLLTFTLVPFFLRDYPLALLPIAFLGLFEGFVHIFAIRLFRCPKFYSPGLVTAELQALFTIGVFACFAKNNTVRPIDYLIGASITVACFMVMQKTITKMVGVRYGDMPKILKRQLAKKD